MRASIVALGLAALLAGCSSTGSSSGPGIEPIPGSITYNGQPRTKLTKAPVGSTFPHEFYNQWGDRVIETYRIQPDRSLKLEDRRVLVEAIFD